MPHQSVSIYLCGGSSTIYYHYELDKENYYHDNMTKEAEKDSRTEKVLKHEGTVLHPMIESILNIACFYNHFQSFTHTASPKQQVFIVL